MTSPYRLHYLLVAALWAAACQRDADAIFDDSGLASAGRTAAAGRGEGGAEPVSEGGAVDAEAGAPALAGTANGGTSGGMPSGSGEGGAGSSVGNAGKAAGGTSVAGGAGSGGSAGTLPMDPKPVTYETRELDDAQIASCRPFENFGSEPTFSVDASGSGGPGNCVYEALLAPRLATLPEGVTIQSATLTLRCTNPGAAVEVWYVDSPWEELQVTWTKRPDRGAALGSLTCEQAGPVSFDLTTAAQAWVSGKHANNGVYLTTEGDNGSDFSSREAKVEAERPLLTVVYLPPS